MAISFTSPAPTEWARQWILLSRRERFQPGTSCHKLWLSTGGSAGHSGEFGIDINEGLTADPGGRRWEVAILNDADLQAAKTAKQQEAAAAKQQEVIGFLSRCWPEGETVKAIRDAVGLNGEKIKIVISTLTNQGAIESCQISKQFGKGMRSIEGWRLTFDPSNSSSGHRVMIGSRPDGPGHDSRSGHRVSPYKGDPMTDPIMDGDRTSSSKQASCPDHGRDLPTPQPHPTKPGREVVTI